MLKYDQQRSGGFPMTLTFATLEALLFACIADLTLVRYRAKLFAILCPCDRRPAKPISQSVAKNR